MLRSGIRRGVEEGVGEVVEGIKDLGRPNPFILNNLAGQLFL